MVRAHRLTGGRSVAHVHHAPASGHFMASLAAHAAFIVALAFAAALVFGLIV